MKAFPTPIAMQTSKHPFLADMDVAHIDTLLHGAQDQAFEANEIIFREGDPANRLYLIHSGEVVLEARCPDDGMVHIDTLRGGDVLGWSWLFPPFAWNFQARAVKPTRVIACDGGHLLVASEEDSRLGYDLMKRVTRVLIHRLKAARQKLINVQGALSDQATTMR